MAQDRTNSTPFIHATQYSNFILEQLPEVLLPDTFTRDVSDFGSGTTLNIKSVGTRTIQDVAEGQPLTFNAIDTNNITMTITDYPGDAWYVSDELKEDGDQVDQLMAMSAEESTRAMGEYFESRFLATCENAQSTKTSAGNTINGDTHRITALSDATTPVEGEIGPSDFAYMNYAMTTARVPQQGRIAIVPPQAAYWMDTIGNIVNVSNNPMFEGMVTEGFQQDHRFVKNVFGWDVYVSNLLPATLTNEAGSTTDREAGATAADTTGWQPCIFMNIASDNTKPIMRAWRRSPQVEGWRDHEERRDKFQLTARLGFGVQRVDSLGIVLVKPSV